MKRIFVTLCILIIFLILYLLQSNFFTWFNIAGVKPNLFILLVLSIRFVYTEEELVLV